jgi:D-alanyl-D-alanine-carboxypeptidase/D-alanyl-D-alanine-endopeptidase
LTSVRAPCWTFGSWMKSTAVLLMLISAETAARDQASAAVRSKNWLDRGMKAAGSRYIANSCHVGLSIAAVADGQARFYNFGSTTRDRRQVPTPDSVYELASVTKTFVGALVSHALVERRMTLDTDFRRYLPESYPNLAAGNQPITLRTLATHTSGLQRDLPDSDALLAKPNYDQIGSQLATLNKGFGRARSLEALHGVTLKSVPGERFLYSNLGIRVIGYGLEHVYREPLPRLLDRFIFGPQNMSSTSFRLSASMRARLVTPYGRSGRKQPYHDASAGAAYGLFSTPRDMAKYLQWQLRETDPVIARAHVPVRGSRKDGDGLIWHVGEDGGEHILWHGGGSFGQTSQIVLFPARKVGFVLLANDACEGSEAELKRIAISARTARQK